MIHYAIGPAYLEQSDKQIAKIKQLPVTGKRDKVARGKFTIFPTPTNMQRCRTKHCQKRGQTCVRESSAAILTARVRWKCPQTS